MTRVLVTGGCGFIGRNLIAALLADDPDRSITVLDNESVCTRESLDDFDGRTICGDISDPSCLRSALMGVDEVIHLAAATSVVGSIARPEASFQTNVEGTFRLLDQCRRLGVRRVLFASTAGASRREDEAQPVTPYGASKLAGEAYCAAYGASYGLACASLRFSNIYGPGSAHKTTALATFLKQIRAGREIVVYGDGTQSRDFLFVTDLCTGILQALRSPLTGVFNLASGHSTTINALVQTAIEVARADCVPVSYRPARGEVHSVSCDISKARAAFGFKPVTRLADGVEQTWRSMRFRAADQALPSHASA